MTGGVVVRNTLCKNARLQGCKVSGLGADELCPTFLAGLLYPAFLAPSADDGIEGAVGVFGALECLDVNHGEGLRQLAEDVLVGCVAAAAEVSLQPVPMLYRCQAPAPSGDAVL